YDGYQDYDLLVFTSVKHGRAIDLPAWNAINSNDVAANGIGLSYQGVIPPVQPLIFNAGFAHDPALIPGASGARAGRPIPYGKGYAMLVEKGKPFQIEAVFAPYNGPRAFRGTPVVGSLTGAGGYPQQPVLLRDLGWIGLSFHADTPFESGHLFNNFADYNN